MKREKKYTWEDLRMTKELKAGSIRRIPTLYLKLNMIREVIASREKRLAEGINNIDLILRFS